MTLIFEKKSINYISAKIALVQLCWIIQRNYKVMNELNKIVEVKIQFRKIIQHNWPGFLLDYPTKMLFLNFPKIDVNFFNSVFFFNVINKNFGITSS